ncbi:ribosomal protein L30, ferredoxin-like fold domain-containing protein, partial [Baffinella frigidus]
QVLLAVRLKGSKGIDAKSKKVLHVFRLHEVNTAVLIKASPTNAKMLALVAPYVKYGAPTLKTVRDLVLKRGFACVPEEGTTKGPKLRVPLSSNQVVEDLLGKHGMVCLEDVINELHSAGPNFRETNQASLPTRGC